MLGDSVPHPKLFVFGDGYRHGRVMKPVHISVDWTVVVKRQSTQSGIHIHERKNFGASVADAFFLKIARVVQLDKNPVVLNGYSLVESSKVSVVTMSAMSRGIM